MNLFRIFSLSDCNFCSDQMVNPDVRDDMPIADFTAASSSRGFGPTQRAAQAEVPQDRFQ